MVNDKLCQERLWSCPEDEHIKTIQQCPTTSWGEESTYLYISNNDIINIFCVSSMLRFDARGSKHVFVRPVARPYLPKKEANDWFWISYESC